MKTSLSYSLFRNNPGPEDVTEAVIDFVSFLREHGATNSRYLEQFELLCAELLNNAVEHGMRSGGERFFGIRATLDEKGVELVVEDPSPEVAGIENYELPENPLDEGGRGFFLARKMSDACWEEVREGYHRVIARKDFVTTEKPYRPGREANISEEMTGEILASYEMINTLLGLSEWLTTAPDMDAFVKGALERLCDVLNANLAYIRIAEQGGLQLLHAWGEGGKEPLPFLSETTLGIETEVHRSGSEFTASSTDQIPPDDPLAGLFTHGVIIPIFFKETCAGVLVVGRVQRGDFFDARQLKIARTVAEYLGITKALETFQHQHAEEELALRDLEIAARVQASLMPKEFGFLQGFDVHGVCNPALRAGGDFFDLMSLGGGLYYVIIADVMGKGLSAALLASMFRSNWRTILRLKTLDPAAFLAEINRVMFDDLRKLDRFITVVCGRFEDGADRLFLSSAGHHLGFLQERSGTVHSIDEAGVPLGVFAETEYPLVELPFRKGDRFLFYTDGIAEALSPTEVSFGEDGIRRTLKNSYTLPSCAAVEMLLRAVDVHGGGAMPSDDCTALLFARTR